LAIGRCSTAPSLVIDKSERIGLIGRNGAGKSSLLKVVAGEIQADDGVVWRKPDLRLAFVAQEPTFTPGHTVFEAVAAGAGPAHGLFSAYHAAAHEAASGEARDGRTGALVARTRSA
jgi:ABC transport system ATP-binding/permease protein